MRSFLGDYIFGGFWTTRREIGAERTTNTHVLGKGRPGEKVGVERTTRTEYTLELIVLTIIIIVPWTSYKYRVFIVIVRYYYLAIRILKLVLPFDLF